MIARWPMGERFVITTPPVKRVQRKILAPKRSSQELENFD
jgi:hypothetical protein